jgi:hypothetical protein
MIFLMVKAKGKSHDFCKEGQAMQWPSEKGQNDKQ